MTDFSVYTGTPPIFISVFSDTFGFSAKINSKLFMENLPIYNFFQFFFLFSILIFAWPIVFDVVTHLYSTNRRKAITVCVIYWRHGNIFKTYQSLQRHFEPLSLKEDST